MCTYFTIAQFTGLIQYACRGYQDSTGYFSFLMNSFLRELIFSKQAVKTDEMPHYATVHLDLVRSH